MIVGLFFDQLKKHIAVHTYRKKVKHRQDRFVLLSMFLFSFVEPLISTVGYIVQMYTRITAKTLHIDLTTVMIVKALKQVFCVTVFFQTRTTGIMTAVIINTV